MDVARYCRTKSLFMPYLISENQQGLLTCAGIIPFTRYDIPCVMSYKVYDKYTTSSYCNIHSTKIIYPLYQRTYTAF